MNRRHRRAQAKRAPSATPVGPSPLQRMLAGAMELHRAARFDEAKESYAQVLAAEPDNPACLHLFGVLVAQRGSFEEGLELVRKAVRLKPDYLEAFSNLGKLLYDAKRYDEALAASRRAVELGDSFAPAHFNLGNVLKELGRSEEAAASYRRAVELAATYPKAYYNLGGALRDAERKDEAVDAYRKAIEQQPEFAEAHNNLGATLRDLGLHEEAVAACRRAIELKPDLPESFSNMGDSLHELRRDEEALVACRRAIELRPEFPEAHNNLGNALQALGRKNEALVAYRRATELRPGFVEAYVNLGAVLHDLARDREGVEACRRAIELKPDLAEAHNNLSAALSGLGLAEEALAASRRAVALRPDRASSYVNFAVVLQELGETADALAMSDKALELDPQSARAWYVRSDLKSFAAGDPDIPAMEALRAITDERRLGLDDRPYLEFALGKAWMDVGEADRAFAHLEAGNRMKRSTFTYNVADDVANLRRIAEVFTPALMAGLAGAGDDRDLPIFVVGMPRSGTTLVEQILASHSEVHGAGELNTVGDVLTEAAERGDIRELFPQLMLGLSRETQAGLGRAYVEAVRALGGGKRRVVDKKPGNYRFAGLIHLMLPNARIIHCRRDPIDTCLSCYAKNFVGRQDFAYDLRELGVRYRAYAALLAHWRRLLPADRLIEVVYEDVVDDLEGQARRLLDFCGLPFEAACLNFHETRRTVRTASVNQVRRPLYRTSVARWKPYERHLGPLIDALGLAAAEAG